MDDAGRHLYAAGRFGLRLVEHQVAVIAATAFWPDGRRVPMAELQAHGIYRAGIGGSPRAITEALQGLEARRVLRRETEPGAKRQVFTLLDWGGWAWDPPERILDVRAELAALTSRPPRSRISDRAQVLDALWPALTWCPAVTPSPWDRKVGAWVEVGARLAERHGLQVLREAVAEAVADPEAVDPWTASTFEQVFYALALRARRRRGR